MEMVSASRSFTDQDHVRVLAHRRPHPFGEARDVRAELALDDLAVLARVHELDRILEAMILRRRVWFR